MLPVGQNLLFTSHLAIRKTSTCNSLHSTVVFVRIFIEEKNALKLLAINVFGILAFTCMFSSYNLMVKN